MKKSRIVVAIIMSLMLIATLVPTTAFATATKTVSSLNSVPSSWFNTLKNGKITAVKINGGLYYRFTYNGYVLNVKQSGFAVTASNPSLSTVANNLTNSMNARSSRDEWYAKRASSNGSLTYYQDRYLTGTIGWRTKGSDLTDKTKSVKYYKYNLYAYKFSEAASSTNPTVWVKDYGTVGFTYKTYVVSGGKLYTAAQKPTLALSRSTPSHKSVKPYIDVAITNTGVKGLEFSAYKAYGKGYASGNKLKVSDYISLAYLTASAGASAYAGDLKGTVTKLLKTSQYISKSKGEYKSASSATTRLLSNDRLKIHCLRAKFSSPLSLQNTGDYYEAIYYFNKTTSSKTKFKVRLGI